MRLKEPITLASDSILQGKLSMANKKVPQSAIQKWTVQQRYDAQDWAERLYLRASDNILFVPPMPSFLKPFKEVE